MILFWLSYDLVRFSAMVSNVLDGPLLSFPFHQPFPFFYVPSKWFNLEIHNAHKILATTVLFRAFFYLRSSYLLQGARKAVRLRDPEISLQSFFPFPAPVFQCADRENSATTSAIRNSFPLSEFPSSLLRRSGRKLEI